MRTQKIVLDNLARLLRLAAGSVTNEIYFVCTKDSNFGRIRKEMLVCEDCQSAHQMPLVMEVDGPKNMLSL